MFDPKEQTAQVWSNFNCVWVFGEYLKDRFYFQESESNTCWVNSQWKYFFGRADLEVVKKLKYSSDLVYIRSFFKNF